MTDQDEGTQQLRTIEQDVEIIRHSAAVLRGHGRIAPAATRAIITAHLRVASNRRRDPSPIRGGLAKSRFEDDRRRAGSDALPMEPMAADVDQLFVDRCVEHRTRVLTDTRSDRSRARVPVA
jgi:hypothetical protein